jgi:hypothetical protein
MVLVDLSVITKAWPSLVKEICGTFEAIVLKGFIELRRGVSVLLLVILKTRDITFATGIHNIHKIFVLRNAHRFCASRIFFDKSLRPKLVILSNDISLLPAFTANSSFFVICYYNCSLVTKSTACSFPPV